MQRAEKNEFADFEVIDTPDYTKSFDATANLDAWDDAAKQAEANGQQRLANARQGIRNQEAVFQLSPKLAKFYKDQMDAADKRFENRARELNQELLQNGVSLNVEALAEYNRNEENFNKVSGYFDVEAAKLEEAGKGELAEKVRNLTGRRARAMKRILLMQSTNDYEDNLWSHIDEISIEREGEPDLTWSNAEDTADRRMLQSRWREEKGLNISDIGKFSDEFLEDIYYKKTRQVDERILSSSAENAKALRQTERLNDAKSIFTEAAKLNNGELGKAVIAWSEQNRGEYNGLGNARLKARELLFGLVTDGSITVEEYNSIYLHVFDHKGTGSQENIGIYKEFNPEDPVQDSLLNQALIKRAQNVQAENKANDLLFVEKVHAAAKAQGKPFNEVELKQIIAGWYENNPGRDLPQGLKDQAYRTIEDQEDSILVAEMQFRKDKGLPIGDLWMDISGDDTLKKKWQEIAESDLGQGLDPKLAKRHKKAIKSEIEAHFNMTMGVSETQSPEFLLMLNHAEDYYAALYREAPFENSKEKANYAFTTVQQMIASDDKRLKVRPTVDWSQSYNKKRQSALTYINKNGSQSIKKGILPGTEEDFKVLEKWALNPTDDIPYIYHVLAKAITSDKAKGRGYDGWDLANEQYRAVHGKDLPKPQKKEMLNKMSPIIQKLFTNKPSNKTITQGAIYYKNDGNFNVEGAVLPGLVVDLEAVG